MIIRHNIAGQKTHGNLKAAGKKEAKAMERLSSGFRISGAYDDASGLAISEKMRGRIRGLAQAARNTEDGVSLIKTADGGMSSIHGMLHRMKELAVYASNEGVLTDGDKQKIQDEIDQLKAEINTVAERTEYNNIPVLMGGEKELIRVGGGGGVGDIPPAVIPPGAGIDDPLPDDGVVRKVGQNFMSAYPPGDGNGPVGGGWYPVLKTDTGAQLNLGYAAAYSSPVYGRIYDTDGTFQVFSVYGFSPDPANNPSMTGSTIKATYVSGGITDPTAFQAVYNVTGTYADGSQFDFDVVESISIVRNRFNGESYEYSHQIINKGDSALDVGLNVSIDAQSGGFNINGNSVYVNGDLDTGYASGLWPRGSLNGGPQIGYDPSGRSNLQTNIDIFAGGDGPDFFMMKETFNPFSDDRIPPSRPSGSEFTVEWTSRTIAAGATSENMMFHYGLGDIGYKPEWDAKPEEPQPSAEPQIPQILEIQTKDFWLQTGPDGGQGFFIGLPDMRPEALGLPNGIPDVMSYINAKASLDYIDEAASVVSRERAKMGAIENRLEFTLDYLQNAHEDISDAESRIRDADMAKEMMELTKSQTLKQVGVSVLAQANQEPQAVLQLLRQ